MIVWSYSNIDIIQGVIGYGNATEGITDWRITNTSGGVFNILNSSSIITPSGGISEIGEIPGTTDRYMIFREGTSTITVPLGGIVCDILVVGGGGGGKGLGSDRLEQCACGLCRACCWVRSAIVPCSRGDRVRVGAC
jgi:hypothetical protein